MIHWPYLCADCPWMPDIAIRMLCFSCVPCCEFAPAARQTVMIPAGLGVLPGPSSPLGIFFFFSGKKIDSPHEHFFWSQDRLYVSVCFADAHDGDKRKGISLRYTRVSLPPSKFLSCYLRGWFILNVHARVRQKVSVSQRGVAIPAYFNLASSRLLLFLFFVTFVGRSNFRRKEWKSERCRAYSWQTARP